MPRKWKREEENKHRKVLEDLYIKKNLTIFEVGKTLGIKYQTVYDRLKRLDIKTIPYLKENYTNKRKLNTNGYSIELAEFIGIMCGDGHVSDEQVFVFLGTKPNEYGDYVKELFKKIFWYELKEMAKDSKYLTLYLGFRELVKLLMSMGLVKNKVKEQMGAPKWIFENENFMKAFIRGFLDTDGSVYKLRWGTQISFCNRSVPLLKDTRRMLKLLGFNPSKISDQNLYLTRKADLKKFLIEIGSSNPKKLNRLQKWVGTEVDKPGAL
ncbi:MAG: LAGLIDADG family homing endonuclease [Patescibacteria group bacterium]